MGSGTNIGKQNRTIRNGVVALIVAHPDDETLWAGGTVLGHPSWNYFVVCLCRGSDTDRASKFHNALKALNAEGVMGDLDDGPEQLPLDEFVLENEILNLLPSIHFDLIITHNPKGEYTRHLRHEETSRAVLNLWQSGQISASELWTFAYEDGHKKYLPQAVETASIYRVLSKRIWLRKSGIITGIYGFGEGSWEAETTPRAEAFWRFTNPAEIKKRIKNKGVIL